MISKRIKKLQIYFSLGSWPKSSSSGGGWCQLLPCDLMYFKKPKGITEAFPELAGKSGTKNQGLTHVISLEKVEFGH